MKKHFPGFVSFGCGGEGRLEEVQGRLREEGFQVGPELRLRDVCI